MNETKRAREEIVGHDVNAKHGMWIEGASVGTHDCHGGREVEYVGDCGEGCCSYYRCNVCGAGFKVEWPD